MRLLLIDTCGAAGTVALADTEAGEQVVRSEVLPGRSASERLIPVIRDLLEAQRWTLRELAAIAVVNGPGSFTGVRVGLSAAKGLCEASGARLVAVSRLAVLAALADAVSAVTGDALEKGRTHVALDAGRGEFYYGAYDAGTCVVEELLTHEQLVNVVGEAPVAVCEEVCERTLGRLKVQVVREPRAEDALTLVKRRVNEGLFDDVALVDANYVRRTDTQLFARAVAPTAGAAAS